MECHWVLGKGDYKPGWGRRWGSEIFAPGMAVGSDLLRRELQKESALCQLSLVWFSGEEGVIVNETTKAKCRAGEQATNTCLWGAMGLRPGTVVPRLLFAILGPMKASPFLHVSVVRPAQLGMGQKGVR